jgi:hypothetical protein
LALEGRIQVLDAIQADLVLLGDDLVEIWAQYSRVIGRIDELGDRDLSASDEAKLAGLIAGFREQLHLYGLASLPVDEIEVSRETFRPTHEGFDLNFDLSASDGVRTKWAYLFALLGVSEAFDTNHPGFVMLDEPRQHATAEVSFAAFLQYITRTFGATNQVVITTSEDATTLREILDGLSHNFFDFGSAKLLERIPSGTTELI